MTATTEANVKKRRTKEQKYGKYKWVRILIERNTREIREIKRMLRGLYLGLSHQMHFDSKCLADIVCRDSRDERLLEVLLDAGPAGLPPKQIHAKLKRHGLKYHHVTRRIKRMNKRLQRYIGRDVAEKMGWNWVLSDFMLSNLGTKINEI